MSASTHRPQRENRLHKRTLRREPAATFPFPEFRSSVPEYANFETNIWPDKYNLRLLRPADRGKTPIHPLPKQNKESETGKQSGVPLHTAGYSDIDSFYVSYVISLSLQIIAQVPGRTSLRTIKPCLRHKAITASYLCSLGTAKPDVIQCNPLSQTANRNKLHTVKTENFFI